MTERQYDYNPRLVGLVFHRIGDEDPLPLMNQFAELISAWLRSAGVFIGEGKENIQVEYNDVYHFFDVSLFAHMENRGEARTAHFQEAVNALRAAGHHVDVDCMGSTWDWREPQPKWGAFSKDETVNGKVRVPGIRFWIKAVEVVREERDDLLRRAYEAIYEVTEEPHNSRYFWSAQKVREDIRSALGLVKEVPCPPTVPGAETTRKRAPRSKGSAETPTASTPRSRAATKRRSSPGRSSSRAAATRPSRASSRGVTKSTSKTRRRTTKSA